MADAMTLHVISRGELAENDFVDRWEDQEEIAHDGTTVTVVRMADEKRRAILDSPFAGGDDQPVRIVAIAGNRGVGRCDVLPGTVEVRGEVVPCLVGSSLYVTKPYRDSLAGPRIVMKLNSLHHTIVGCGVSKAALPVFTGLKWRAVPMPRYVLLRHSRPVVERRLGTGPLARIATAGVDAGLVVHRGALAAGRAVSCSGLSVEAVQTLPAEVDRRSAQSDAPAALWRGSDSVHWLLTHSFRADPSFRKGLYLVSDRRGRVVAYFLLKARVWEQASRQEFRNLFLGSLADWEIYDPSKVRVQQLALLAEAELARWDVDAIEFCLPPEYRSTPLGRLGCKHVDAMYFIARVSRDSPLARLRLEDPSTWRIRPASGDHFFT